MAEQPDSRGEDDPEPPPRAASGMESLETFLGRPVDPALELDPVEVTQFPRADAPAASRPESSAPTAGAGPSPAGRHEIEGEIARGGMGAILKVRDKDLRRSLAMKVILGGTTGSTATGQPISDDLLHRFLEEAQVTAQLAHPGVVPVHELGVDHEGRVYFTMSLVRGETLSSVIGKARKGEDGWSMTRALQVLLRVCETMAFAHDKGVIHRDLKPDNVMVGKFGQTYVMDWGLAKVLGRQDSRDIRLKDANPRAASVIQSDRSDQRGTGSPLMTMDGSVVGTPAFMPPEQAEGRVSEMDKRSDVYAIGALLYQLLSGEAPYVKSGTNMSPYAVLAAVSMGPPRTVHEIDASAPEELQAICEKAMAREQAQRYASAAELADDLQRFLSGHVVRAHKTGALIEMKKWVARNKAVATTAGAALVVVAALTAVFLHSLADERDRAVSAEGDARNNAAEADQERKRADARAKEARDERARAEDLASFMLIDLRVRLEPIGRLDLLGDVATKSLEYYRSVPAEGLSDKQQRGRGVALGNVGDVLREQGRLADALRSYRGSHEILERLAAQDPTNTGRQRDLSISHEKIGDVLRAQGDFDGALLNYRSSLDLRTRLVTQDPTHTGWQRDLSISRERVGDVLRTRGDLTGALTSYRAQFEIAERLAAHDPTNADWQRDLSMSHTKLGETLLDQGDRAGALTRFRARSEIARRLAAQDPANAFWQRDLAASHNDVGEVLRAQGDIDGALENYRSGLAIRARLVAQDPTNTDWQRNVAVSHDRIGEVLLAQADLDGALLSYRASLGIFERLAAKDPTNAGWQHDLSFIQSSVGIVLLRQGRSAEAARALRTAEAQHTVAVNLAAHYANEHAEWESLRRGAEIVAGERTAESSADQRALGYTFLVARDFERSVQAYERALADADLRGDPELQCLYDGARAAALASGTGAEREAAYRATAITWLAEDVALRRTALERIESQLAAGNGEATRLEAERAAILRHLERARAGETDLDAIRGTSEFDELFEGLPRGE